MDNQNLSSDDEFDEVSLPGVGDNEQATILEVLNRRIVSTEDGNGNVNVNGTATGIEPTKEERHSGDTLNAIKVTSTPDDEPKTSKQDKESDILVSSSSSSRGQVEWNEPQRSQLNEDEENVFDIESHLIETLNNYSVSEDSESWGVDIKELPPAEGESLYRTSKIETDPSIGTVFEVEPATPKVLKPVETSVPEPQRQSGLAQKAEEEQTSVDSEVKRQESVSEVEQPKKRRKPGETSVSEPQKQSGLAQKAQEDETSVDSEVKDSNAEKQQESVIEVEQPKEKRDLGETSVAEPQRQSGLAQKAQEEQISIDSEVKGSNAKKEQESVSEVEQSKEKKEPDETTSPEPQRQSGLAQKAQEERTSANSEVKDSNAKKQQESVIEVEKSKEKRESDEITSPEPQGQSELEQEENIFADSEVRGSNAEKKPESVNKVESPKQRTEQAETTVPEPQKNSGPGQKAQGEQISVDFDQEIKSTNVEKKPESLKKVNQSDESIEPAETTVPEAQSGIAQNIRAVIDPPADDNEPVWKILKELQTQLEAAQVEPSALPTKVELDRCEESSSVSNENTEPKLYLAASAEEISGPVVQSNEVEKPLETAGLKIIDSEGATDPTKSKTDSITQDQKVELILESVDSTEQVKPEIVTPTEPLQKAEEELVHGSINVSSTTEEPKADHHEKPIPVGDSSAGKQGDTHDTVDNAQSINATKIQIDPTAPDPRVDVQALTEKLLIRATIEKSNEDTKTDLLSKEREHTSTGVEDSASLTQEIDQKLSELATHLASSSKVDLNGNIPKETSSHLESEEIALDINGLPLPKTAHEEEQRQQFLDSLPQISLETDSNKVAALAKREYYQSLRQYLITHSDKPPVPPETYRWEDLKRAKQRGGYPWTHLYKRPLGTDEEPEIVLLLRKSQELRFSSESPKSSKKVRIDDQVSIKETERYIQELSDVEDNPTTEDEEEAHEDERSECISCVSDSVLTVEKRSSKLGKLRGILKKRSPKKESDARSLPDTSTAPSTSALTRKSEEDISERPRRPPRESQNQAKCFPIMKKLKSMADRQKKNFRNIKKISLKKDEKISLEEEQKIIKLKTSPKAERSEIPHFIEKQDSDDVLEIVELDESPSRKRKDQLELQEQAAAAANESTVLVPDEIIEIPADVDDKSSDRQQTPEPTVSEILEEELKSNPVFAAPPKKTARLRREHVYEDIEDDNGETISDEINNILELASVEALKQSLAKQDSSALKDVDSAKTVIPLDRMGSSEEEVERVHLAPISSIDSASSDDERKPHLSPVAEESDDGITLDKEDTEKLQPVLEVIKEPTEHIPWNDIDLKPALKKEASPSPSDKKVTFSHVEDEAEPHREDIELPEGLPGIGPKRWSNLSDHEYEPIGEPAKEIKSQPTAEPLVSALKKEPSPAPQIQELPKFEISQPVVEATSDEASSPSKSDELKEAEELQKNIEDRYFSSAATPTPIETTQTDYEIHTSQVDLSAFEQPPLKDESKKKGFMANAQDRTRKMQAGLKNQAGKIKTKFRSPKKVPSGSPKAKERKRFKAPEFSKIKMPEIKRPDLSGFKRPEFTKFSKPDMSKFKLPDKFSSLKLTRSKSFKEPTEIEETTVSGTTPESTTAAIAAPAKKARFDFSFGTYPRAFRKKKKPQEVEGIVDEPSVIPSTETQPSAESSSTPQGDRGPGPVRSRWADKFSDVSYNDSEGSRYRRYGSEQESSFDRESSMERRMKEVLDENEKEEAELAMLSVVEKKQFDDYDEENRAIHEISKTREGEFKRRPMVHQDSDLVSEEGRDIGWTEREAQKIQILRKAELEAEAHLRYLTERESNPETHSTASSKKLVFEEINDDEFLLRNKGISQEFNIGNQRFLDPDMEAAFDNSPNALEFIGVQASSLNGSSIDRIDYGYDVPPPKPRRLSHQQRQRHYDSENASQIDEYADEISLSQAGSDYYKHAPPSRPLRKGRFKNSQEISIGGTPSVQFDEEEFDDRVDRALPRHDDDEKENILQDRRNDSPIQPPQAPRRRRKQLRDSLEKDSYVNGFGGRSVSNSYLREDNKPEEVIVYRTEHEYKIPLATPENYTDTSTPPRKSRSLSRLAMDEDDHTSHGADSLALDTAMRGGNNNANLDDELQEKYIIEMMENDGYAIVRKENLPKPTPPARRKKFSRSPGERFATMPHLRRGSPAVQEPKSSSRNYSTIGRPTPPRRKSAQSLGADSQKEFGSEDFGDYEVPELDDRTESPRNLQSGDIINKMKYRPLPPPPRPPREKRHIQRDRQGDDDDEFDSRDDRDDRDGGGERIVSEDFLEQSSDDYNLQPDVDKSIEVEVSTQTDPLPDDFVCEEFEITEDMKIIEPRRAKTLDEILKEEEEADLERARQIDDEVLVKGIQRFREANQRSASEKSRASSQAKSLSRPQTPSAILIEKRVPTPVPYANGQTVLEASLTVQPIDDLDLEEELLRREGLYDGSHSHSKSGSDSRYRDEEEEAARGSEEENARIGEEERSYTRSTDAESQRLEEEEQDRRLVERLLEAERLQREEDEEQRLLEELEKEERLLDAEKQIRLLEEEKRALRLQEEEEKEKQKLLDDLEKEQRLRPDSRSDEHDSYDDEQTERLKAEDSYELKSEVSEENEATPRPTTPISALPPTEEDVISVLQQIKLLSQPKLLEQREKYEPDEEPPSPPPTAPPRKRSTATSPLEDQNEILSVTEQQPATAAVPITPVMPSQLTLADLEVERLRVHALQAGQIMVSHLHGSQIQADELECRSGNLVVRNIELPPGFIEDIVERVRITEREHTQAIAQPTSDEKPQTEQDSIPPPPIPTRHSSDVPPVRPPPPQRESIFPSEYMQPSPSAVFLQHHDGGEPPVFSRSVLPTEYLQSVPPIGFFSHRSPDDEGEPTPPVYRRRRHHRRRDSSSEEDHQRRRSRSARPEPQSVAQAGRQFISACSLPLTNVINQLTNSLRPNNDNKQDQVQPRNISAAVVLFIVMALTFLIYLLTGRNIHHHHWDYFNPPGNDGRLS